MSAPHKKGDRVSAALALLVPPYATIHDPPYVRERLEEVYATGHADALVALRGAADAAAAWGVSHKRATDIIARLHERYGVGQKVAGAWLLLDTDIEQHRPRKYTRPGRGPQR